MRRAPRAPSRAASASRRTRDPARTRTARAARRGRSRRAARAAPWLTGATPLHGHRARREQPEHLAAARQRRELGGGADDAKAIRGGELCAPSSSSRLRRLARSARIAAAEHDVEARRRDLLGDRAFAAVGLQIGGAMTVENAEFDSRCVETMLRGPSHSRPDDVRDERRGRRIRDTRGRHDAGAQAGRGGKLHDRHGVLVAARGRADAARARHDAVAIDVAVFAESGTYSGSAGPPRPRFESALWLRPGMPSSVKLAGFEPRDSCARS